MKRRGAPLHAQMPMFNHPAKDIQLIRILEEIPDLRGAPPNFLEYVESYSGESD